MLAKATKFLHLGQPTLHVGQRSCMSVERIPPPRPVPSQPIPAAYGVAATQHAFLPGRDLECKTSPGHLSCHASSDLVTLRGAIATIPQELL